MKKDEKYYQLVAKLNKCSQVYHGSDAIIISDDEYNQLYRELVAMEKRNPSIIVPESPTQRADEGLSSGFDIVYHRRVMYSLDKVFNVNELTKFWKRFDKLRTILGVDTVNKFYCDHKLDGLACELVYKGGILVNASTRGNGHAGEDITPNIYTLSDKLPKCIITRQEVVVYGTVVAQRIDFNKINARLRSENRQPYANVKSYVTTSLLQKNVEVTRGCELKFFAHDAFIESPNVFKTQMDVLIFLQTCGFSIPKGHICYSVDDIMEFVNEVSTIKNTLDYCATGIVVKQNDLECCRRIGYTNRAPLFNIVYKFSSDTVDTTITNILWPVGRTGRCIPTAVLEPVDFNGSKVTSINLGSASFVESNRLGIGSIITISRTMDALPRLNKIVASNNYTGLPDTCTFCGTKFIRSKNDLICTNPDCISKRIANLKYIVKDVLKIREISDAACSDLIQSGTINSIKDLFVPIENKSKVKQDLLDIIVSKARQLSLAELISILGIPGIGISTAREIIYEAETLPAIVNVFSDNTKLYELAIGTSSKNAISKWYARPQSQELLKNLLSLNIQQWM